MTSPVTQGVPAGYSLCCSNVPQKSVRVECCQSAPGEHEVFLKA